MPLLRRLIVIAFACVLVGSVFWGLLFWRTVTITSDPGWAQQVADDLNVYALLHDEALPAALDTLLLEQDERLPDNLAAIELPTDQASRDTVLALLRETLPTAFVQDRTESWLDAVVPYAFDRTDAFAIEPRLNEPIERAFGHAPGAPSAAERAWRSLDLGRRMIDGAIAQAEAEAGVSIDQLPVAIPPARLTEAAEWLTIAIFDAIDEIRPWLLGETETFRLQITFESFPELAVLLSEMLQRSPQELQSSGFVLDSAQLLDELAGSDSGAAQTIEARLQWFEPQWAYTEADFRADIVDASDEGTDALDTLDTVRSIGGMWRDARWLAPVWVLGLGTVVAATAGGTIQRRLLWALVPMLVGAGTLALLTGVVGAGMEAPGVGGLVESNTGDWHPRFETLAAALDDAAHDAARELVRSVMLLALLWAALLSIATGLTVLWWRRDVTAD